MAETRRVPVSGPQRVRQGDDEYHVMLEVGVDVDVRAGNGLECEGCRH